MLYPEQMGLPNVKCLCIHDGLQAPCQCIIIKHCRLSKSKGAQCNHHIDIHDILLIVWIRSDIYFMMGLSFERDLRPRLSGMLQIPRQRNHYRQLLMRFSRMRGIPQQWNSFQKKKDPIWLDRSKHRWIFCVNSKQDVQVYLLCKMWKIMWSQWCIPLRAKLRLI